MSAAEKLVAQLQRISPSDIPTDIQLVLAEQLRDLAHDLELQARWTRLPSSPALHNGEDHDQEERDTTGRLAESPELDGEDPVLDDGASSSSWETMGSDGILLPSTPCPNRDGDAACTLLDQPFRPANPYEEYAMGLLDSEPGGFETTYSFNNAPSESSGLSQFSQSPGPDRQVGSFIARGRRPATPCTPSPRPVFHTPSNMGSADDICIPLPAPRKKAAWWEPNLSPGASGSSPFDSLTSRNSLPVDLSFTHSSQFLEGKSEYLTPTNPSSPHEVSKSSTTEPSSFQIDGTSIRELKDPFWNSPPLSYPLLNDSDQSIHRRITEPMNRSHKLLLDLQAVRREGSPFTSEPGLPPSLPPGPNELMDLVMVREAAVVALPVSPIKVEAVVRVRDGGEGNVGKRLRKLSMWDRLANVAMRVVGHKKHAPREQNRKKR